MSSPTESGSPAPNRPSQRARAATVRRPRRPSVLRIFGPVGAMAILTYVAEYASFVVLLAFISTKFDVTFQLGGFGYFFVGLVSSAFLVSSGLVAIVMGHFADKHGRRKMTILGCILGAVSLISLIFGDSANQLAPFAIATAISLVALGLAHGTYTSSTLAYGGDLAERHKMMGKAYGIVDGAEFAGFSFGPALGTTVGFLTKSSTAVFELSAFLMLIAAALAVVAMPEARDALQKAAPGGAEPQSQVKPPEHVVSEDEEAHAHVHAHSHAGSWRDYVNAFRIPIIGVALLTTLVGAVGFAAFFYYVPLYANSLVSQVPAFALFYGYFASIMAVTGVLFMVPFGHYEDKRSARMPYLVAGLIGAAGALALVFFTATLATFLAAAVGFGLAIGMVRVSQLVILAESSTTTNRATIMGTNHAMEHVGYGIASLLTGSLIAFTGGFAPAFRILAIILILSGALFLVYARRAKVK